MRRISFALAALCLAASAARAGPGDREALRRAIDELLSQQPLAGAHVSVQVDSLEDGQTVLARGADDLLNPASNTKLVTSAAALLRLGPEYRFTTDYLADKPLQRGRVSVLYVKGRGDPAVTTERLAGLVADLWHRGLRSVDDIVLDDTHFDREQYAAGWEQESSDKSWAAGVGALSLNHNSVAIYITPADRTGGRARVEVEPETGEYFTVDNEVVTVRANGRRKLRPHTFANGERTRVVVEGRVPVGGDPMVMYRRVGDPTFYYGQVLKQLLRQRGIRVAGHVRRGKAPDSATLIESYESPELAEIVRDMNKVSSNFIAEMLVKTLGAELKGPPGTWPKGLEVTEDLLGELGLPRGTYQLKNGSGLNDTNRFSAHQLTTLLGAIWKRFPVASEFIASLGIAARDGTMRLRMEGTDAAGRLRAKTGTLDHVTALSGFVQSLGGERFVFSILVNDWTGRSGPVLSSIDRMGGMLAASGAPEQSARDAALAALISVAPVEAQPTELKARIATYTALATNADKRNLPFLRSALRTERDPLLRVAVADALYRSDPDQGGGPLLEAMPASPDFFLRLRTVGRELALPVPAVSSLLDLAVDGNGEALARLLAIAPLARGAAHDEQLESLLSDGLLEVGEASPDELTAALRGAPSPQALAAVELLSAGLTQAHRDAAQFPLATRLKAALAKAGPQAGDLQRWIALLERRSPEPLAAAPLSLSTSAVAQASSAALSSAPASVAPSGAPPASAMVGGSPSSVDSAAPAPSVAPAWSASSGAPAWSASSGAPAWSAPSGAPARSAPSGAPAWSAPSGAAASSTPSGASPAPPASFAGSASVSGAPASSAVPAPASSSRANAPGPSAAAVTPAVSPPVPAGQAARSALAGQPSADAPASVGSMPTPAATSPARGAVPASSRGPTPTANPPMASNMPAPAIATAAASLAPGSPALSSPRAPAPGQVPAAAQPAPAPAAPPTSSNPPAASGPTAARPGTDGSGRDKPTSARADAPTNLVAPAVGATHEYHQKAAAPGDVAAPGRWREPPER